jgi:hypothetical protein
MNDDYVGLITALFNHSKKLITADPTRNLDETRSLLDQLAATERASSRQGKAISIVKHTRGDSSELVRIGGDAVAFTLQFNESDVVSVQLEVGATPEGLQLFGVLEAGVNASWRDFSVVLHQGGIIQDFTDGASGVEFTLRLDTLSEITLRFISSQQESVSLTADTTLD